MKSDFEKEYQRLRALKNRLEDAREGKLLRIKYAEVLNKHFKQNGYGHQLFKTVNATNSSTSNGEKDGKSK